MRPISGNILVFAITDSLGNFGRSLIFPYASLYILALGGDAAQIGLIAFLGQLAGLFLLPVAGYVTDRSDRIRLVVAAGFLYCLAQGIVIFALSWEALAVSSLLTGVIVIQFPAYSALIADSLAPESRGKGIGLLNTVSNSLGIFAPFLAGLVIAHFQTETGMRILYTAMVVLNLAATFIQFRFLKETHPASRQPLKPAMLADALAQAYRGIPGLIRQMPPALAALALVIVLTFMTNGLTGTFWVVFATEKQGLSAEEWGIIMLVEALIRVGLFLPAGLLADRWGRKNVLALGLLLGAAMTPLFVAVNGFAAILLVRSVLAVSFVLAFSSCVALMADLVPIPVRGKLMAALGMGGIMPGMVGGAGGPAVGYLIIPFFMLSSLAGGILYQLNPALPWMISTLIGTLSLLLVVFFVRDSHHT